jgi:predicted nuclease with TOPRIM domain
MLTWQKVAFGSIIHKLRNEVMTLNNVLLDKESELEALYQNIDKLTEKTSNLTDDCNNKTAKITSLQKELSMLVNLSRGFKEKIEYMHSICADDMPTSTASVAENAFTNSSSFTRQQSIYNENISKQLYSVMENSQKSFSEKRKEIKTEFKEEDASASADDSQAQTEKKRKVSADFLNPTQEEQKEPTSSNEPLPLENLIEEVWFLFNALK